MIFNEYYKDAAWNGFTSISKQVIEGFSKDYLSLLSKYKKANFDGMALTITVDETWEKTLPLVEIQRFVQMSMLDIILPQKVLEYSRGLYIFEESFDTINVAALLYDAGKNGDAFYEREVEYKRIKTDGISTGVSLPDNTIGDSIREKYAGFLTDCIIATSSARMLFNYEDVCKVSGFSKDKEFPKELYNLALKWFDIMSEKCDLYLTGDITEEWKLKGLCPNCGGNYKGLFTKKCAVCGMNK